MKKTLLISTIGLTIILSACSLQLPTNNKEKDDKTSQLEQQIDQTKENSQKLNKQIIDKISLYCAKYNISECLPITSYSIIHLDDKYSVIKINNFNYLLTKKDTEWSVSIVSQEDNICETGSDSPDLIEYCSQQ